MANNGSSLGNGEHLAGGDWLVSPNGQYLAYMQGDGNFVLYYGNDPTKVMGKDAYWATNTAEGERKDGHAGPYVAVLGDDGNFVLYFGSDPAAVTVKDAYWATKTSLGQDQYTLTLQDDGNLVLFRVSDPDQPEEPCWSALPMVKVQCKFMQNYREASPVNGGKDLVAVRNGSGDLELFTIGNDWKIHTFYPDSSNETGYSEAVVTNDLTKVTALAGCIGPKGYVVLLAATSDPALYYIVETGDPSAPWSVPSRVPITGLPQDAKQISSILMQNIDNTVCAALTIKTNQNQYYVATASWQTSPSGFGLGTAITSFPSDPCCFFQGNTLQNAALAAYFSVPEAPKIILFYVGGRQLSGYIAPSPAPISTASALDANGQDQTFAVLADKNVYHLLRGTDQSGTPTYNWELFWQQDLTNPDAIPVSFQEVVVEADSVGAVHVFAVSMPKPIEKGATDLYCELYHWGPDASSDTGYLSAPVPIFKSSALSVTGVSNNEGSIELFVVDSSNQVYHLFQEQESSEWAVQEIETDSENAPIETYSSYATEFTVFDSSGATAAGATVKLLASEQTRLTVNGGTHFIDEQRWVQLATDDSGMLSIAQETNSLAIPVLFFSLPDMTWSNAPAIVTQPFADVQDKLNKTKPQDLLDATVVDVDDEQTYPLLEAPYNTQDNATSLVQGIQASLDALAPSTLQAAGRAGRPAHQRFWTRSHAAPDDLRRLNPHRQRRSWHMSFEGDKVTYRDLSSEEAAELSSSMLASLPSVSSSSAGGLLKKIGDLVRSAAAAIAKVVDVVVQEAKATMRLIIDGVAYVFQAVVEFIEDVFDMVELFFAQVKVFFKKLYEWLAWMFSWKDIRNTQDMLSYSIDQILEFLEQAAPKLKVLVNANFATLQNNLPAMIQQAEQAVGPTTVGGYEQKNAEPNPQYEAASSNNFFSNEFVLNYTKGTGLTSLQALTASDPITDFMQQFSTFATSLVSGADWGPVQNSLTQLGSNPDNLFTQGLPDLLEKLGQVLLQAVVSGLQSLVSSLFDLAAEAVGYFRDALKQEWNIPFVSKFYTYITGGGTLTVRNLVTLMTAIPATLLYKLVYGRAPFPDDQSMQDFKAALDADVLLAASGLGNAAQRARARQLGDPSSAVLITMATFYSFFTGVNALLSVLSNKVAPNVPASNWLTAASILTLLAATIFRFEPYWTPVEHDCTTGVGAITWSYWLALSLSLLMCVVGGASMFNLWGNLTQIQKNDLVAVSMFQYGFASLVLCSVAASQQVESGAKTAWRIIGCIAPLLALLRHSQIYAMTAVSLRVLTVLALLCGLTTAALGGYVLAVE